MKYDVWLLLAKERIEMVAEELKGENKKSLIEAIKLINEALEVIDVERKS